MEYCEVIEEAATEQDPMRRLALVALFMIT